LAIKRYLAFVAIGFLLCPILTYYTVKGPLGDGGKTAMAKVDAQPYEFEMQRDFVDPGGFGEALGNDVSLLRKAIAPTRKVLDTARRRDMLVIHTREEI